MWLFIEHEDKLICLQNKNIKLSGKSILISSEPLAKRIASGNSDVLKYESEEQAREVFGDITNKIWGGTLVIKETLSQPDRST